MPDDELTDGEDEVTLDEEADVDVDALVDVELEVEALLLVACVDDDEVPGIV